MPVAEGPGRHKRGGVPAPAAFRRGIRVVEALVAAILLILVLEWALGFSFFDPGFWSAFVAPSEGQSRFLRGFQGTAYFSLLVIPVGLAIGFFTGWARSSQLRFLRWPATVYIEFFRGTPALILVIFAALFGILIVRGVNQFEVSLLLGAMALALHTGAYQAEIFRAGFQSVPHSQVEAAYSIGMSRAATMRFVVLPQALRLSLPPLGNEFSSVIKDTALLYAIGATELFGQGLEFSQLALRTDASWVFPMWVLIAAGYFLVTFVVTRAVNALERRIRVPGLKGAPV